MYHIRTYNQIHPTGLQFFPKKLYEINQSEQKKDGILLRSHPLSSECITEDLKIVARAGAGINHLPVEKLTKAGIPVVNTPGANANAVKELVLCAIIMASRHIPKALAFVHETNEQIEAQKHLFRGSELVDKTIAVIGLGHIGVKVANAASAMGMKVLGYDPYLQLSHAWQLSAQVQQAKDLPSCLKQADFVTLHLPLTPNTKQLINQESLSHIKKTAYVINFARSAIVNHHAVLEALHNHKIAGYVTDFPTEDLKHPNVIALPHLGASTEQAEENCAVWAAKAIRAFLEYGELTHAINFPAIQLPRQHPHRVIITNDNIPNVLGSISTTLAKAGYNILEMLNQCKDEVAVTVVDIEKPITDALGQAINRLPGVLKLYQLPPLYDLPKETF